MKLREIVVETAIITSLKSTKRDEVLGELLDALVSSDAIAADKKTLYLKEALKRERKGSTGFGHGVAVPHVKAAGLDQLTVAIGISEAGVDFNALDKQPVHSIFRRFLRQAGDVKEIITLLEEADAGQSVG